MICHSPWSFSAVFAGMDWTIPFLGFARQILQAGIRAQKPLSAFLGLVLFPLGQVIFSPHLHHEQ